MRFNRRSFLKALAGCAAAACPVGLARGAEAAASLDAARTGVLVDTTKCIGCRCCEVACADKNGLPPPIRTCDPTIFEIQRTTDTRALTVVNAAASTSVAKPHRFAKRQCMHCLEPACASACLVRALDKLPAGPVVYHQDRCMGCRYCMVACPFGVPKYEYESALPYVRKCTFCADRQAKGLAPACTNACPSGALKFGLRDELLEVARERIYAPGSPYVRRIYGEHEVGGTSWLYLADLPAARLGLPQDVGTYPYSALTQASLSVVPLVITLWPPLLMGLHTFATRRAQGMKDEAAAEEATHV